MDIIDSHCHLWKLGISGKTWIKPELGPLFRSFEPGDLLSAPENTNVNSFIVVEAGESHQENQGLADMAEESKAISGFITWANLENPELEEEIRFWSLYPKFRGVRMRFEGNDDPAFLSKESIKNGLSVISNIGCIFEFLIQTHHLEDVLKLCEENPDLRGIIEHMAKPDMLYQSDKEKWTESMRYLAKNTNIYCKMSLSPRSQDMSKFLNTTIKPLSSEDIKPFVQHIMTEFDTEKLIWGSDWPISSVTNTYDETYQLMEDSIGQINSYEKDRLFKDNAIEFYGL